MTSIDPKPKKRLHSPKVDQMSKVASEKDKIRERLELLYNSYADGRTQLLTYQSFLKILRATGLLEQRNTAPGTSSSRQNYG